MMRRTALSLALGLTFPALAQQAPDAGQTLRETQPPVLQPPGPAPGVEIAPVREPEPAEGGARLAVSRVRLVGNTVFGEAELLGLLGEVRGEYDLAGLKRLARRITEHYRAHGYPYAQALVPAQKLEGGVLEIRIVEGRYGKVKVEGEQAEAAQAFLSDLREGALITRGELERATLILRDQPGVQIKPLLRPGQEVGTGDLVIEVSRTPLLKGEVGLDNHGNRYSGANRLQASVRADSPFMLGDQIQGRLLYTDEGLWLGSLGYSLPLGGSGLRGSLGYAHTYYQLGKDFANLQARGTARVASAGLSYPLLRSQSANLVLGATIQHKDLEDRQDATATRNGKQSDSLPLTVQFDRRDAGGLTYGALGLTAGRLDLDAALTAQDIASGTNTRGGFVKWNLDLARLQATAMQNLALFARLSAQWANKNLDSSESFILGGASGVRAYPQGEGAGDEGAFVQLEARYRFGPLEPFVFYDAGWVRINARPGSITPAVTNNTRSLAGAGTGLRYGSGPWSLEAALAWRTRGGAPTADTQDRHPRAWLTAGYRF